MIDYLSLPQTWLILFLVLVVVFIVNKTLEKKHSEKTIIISFLRWLQIILLALIIGGILMFFLFAYTLTGNPWGLFKRLLGFY